MSNPEMAQEALSRARSGQPCINDALVIAAFMERGIPACEITPRENCLTFNAWKALGRCVRKGEHGVPVVTWIPMKGREPAEGQEAERGSMRPKTAYVFHVSQTKEL